MISPFDPIDEETLTKVLSSPPFITVQGVCNFRGVGGYPVSQANLLVKTGYYYRSGDPSHITDKGKETLRNLGIKKVFDFRANHEAAKFDAPRPSIDGVEFIRAPVSSEEAFDPLSIAKVLKMYEMNEPETFRLEYTRALKSGGKAFGIVLRHMRDKPHEPCLVHCTAGKDRTGLFTAVWLATLGVSDEDIAKDYALTTYGLIPAIPILRASLEKQQVFQDNWQGAMNMGTSKYQTMMDLLEIIRDQFGGVDEYLKSYTGLTDVDITTIRGHYLIPQVVA